MMRGKGSREPDPMETRDLPPEQIDRAMVKLGRRIDEVQELKSQGARWNGAQTRVVETTVRDTVRDVFGPRSPEFRDFGHFEIRHGPVRIGLEDDEYQESFLLGITDASTLLEGLIHRLEERKEDLVDAIPSTPKPGPGVAPSRKVFLVHGHDDAAKGAAARFLSQLDLEPVILHEQPNEGRTIIEKFEKYADVAFAVVLLTPDDLGASVPPGSDPVPRARQNVIFELGFFVGKLGRDKVCALHKGETEILSDYQGVLYVPMDTAGAWKLLLAREISAAGIGVDMSQIK